MSLRALICWDFLKYLWKLIKRSKHSNYATNIRCSALEIKGRTSKVSRTLIQRGQILRENVSVSNCLVTANHKTISLLYLQGHHVVVSVGQRSTWAQPYHRILYRGSQNNPILKKMFSNFSIERQWGEKDDELVSTENVEFCPIWFATTRPIFRVSHFRQK